MTPPARAGFLRSDKAFYLFAALLIAVTASITALAAFGMETLSEVRAYVHGEGRWSKGQKDAVLKLRLYIDTGDERDYAQFLANLAVPLSDHRARLEMEKPAFDRARAGESFVGGGNHPADVPGMIRFFRSFRRHPRLQEVIRIWEEADVEIAALAAVGERVHRTIASGEPDRKGLAATLAEMDAINTRLTALEVNFSQSLGEAARWLTRVLLQLILAVGLLLAGLAIWLAGALLRRFRRGEEALLESELLYKSLVEQSPFGIFRSTPAGRIVAANQAMVAMLGFGSEPELLETDLSTGVYVDGTARARLIESVREHGNASAENAWRRKDGRIIAVRQTARVVLDAEGEPLHFSTIAEDITERRELESQLRQAQKMEAIGQLASGVAHDFNNLLAAILGSAEILLEELPEGGASRDDAAEIRGAALRAADLTRQLLAFGRKQALAPQLLSLNELIERMEKLLRRTLGEEVELRTVLSPSLGAARADPTQLEQVIVNLAVNARDAMAKGGKLTVETANVELDGAYVARHPLVLPGSYVMMAVSDTGAGMSAEVQARIFEPFFTTKPRDKGTGLGLATVYGIVKQSGGFVWVYSEPGTGTVFKVYLPRVAGSAGQPAPAAPEGKLLGGSETLLVAEDQVEVRKYTRKLLEARGYAVLSAASGPEALELAAGHHGPIHALVTDVIMPGMTGRELAVELVKERPRTRVLYLSGYADESIVHHGVLEPGVAFLQKPFTADALARKLRALLDREEER